MADPTVPTHAEEPVGEACPSFAAAMDIVGRRWNGIVVQAIGHGHSGYTDIRRYVGRIGDTMLARRLRELEACGLVTRAVRAGPPVVVEYGLTDAGRDLIPILETLTAWGHAHTQATEHPSR